MTEDPADPLPPEAALALAWSGPMVRAPLSTVLQLDRRLARIVGRTREPMLGQMRLAWWRDALDNPVAERPRGDVVLDAIGVHWAGREAALVALVGGWEVLVTAERLGPDELESFAAGRGAFFAALAAEAAPDTLRDHLGSLGRCWALADAAAGVSDPAERQALVAAGLVTSGGKGVRVPRDLRGLAVLAALSRRALALGGRPLMEGRAASLAALRAAILGA